MVNLINAIDKSVFTSIVKYSCLICLLYIMNSPSLFSQSKYDKCDFIIDEVSYKITYQDRNDRTGMPGINKYKMLDVVISIKNIGKKNFLGMLYLARTNSKDDFLLNYYSKYVPVQPGIFSLPANVTCSKKFSFRIDRNLKEMIFKINEYPDYDFVQDESDYFNNTYLIEFE